MTRFVIDSSAYVQVIGSGSGDRMRLRNRLVAGECHAPHLVDVEVGSVLRRRVLAGALDAGVALAGLRALRRLVDRRYEHTGILAEQAWRLRGSITFYDAVYAALAAALDLPLLTADARLARAPGLPCQVELVG